MSDDGCGVLDKSLDQIADASCGVLNQRRRLFRFLIGRWITGIFTAGDRCTLLEHVRGNLGFLTARRLMFE